MVAVSRRAKLLGLIGGLVLATVAFSLSGSMGNDGRGQVALGDFQPWPAFSMKYREERHFGGAGYPVTYEVWQFDYVDRNHWRHELLESSYDPRQVGSWSSFDGTTWTQYGAGIGFYHVDQIPPPDVAVADNWLVPGLASWLPSHKGYQQIESGRPDRLRFIKTDTVTCRGGPPACPDANRVTYTGIEEWTYTKEHGIPVEMVATQDDGQVYRRITVLSLIIK